MKAKILQITAELLVEMCKPAPGVGWCLESHGLPLDARLAEARVHAEDRGTILLKVVSESWPEVELGELLPHVEPPRFKRIPQPGWTDPEQSS